MEEEKFSKSVFGFFLLAIAPTIIMGILKVSTYTNVLIWIWDVLMIIVLVAYCVLNRYKIYKKDCVYVLLFLIVIVFQILDYLVADGKTINKLYIVLPLVYFMHFLCSFTMIGGRSKSVDWKKFFKIFTFFVFFCCLYNLIINFNSFSRVLSFNNKYLGFSSFFNHRNGFGQLLFVGVISNIFVLTYEKKKRYYATLLVILINLVLTFSRTSILSTVVFFVVYFLQNMFSKKEKRSTLIAILFIIIMIILVFVGINNKQLLNFVNYYIFRSEDGLSGRDTIWENALSNVKGIQVLSGYGIGMTGNLLKDYGVTNSHNTFIEIILTGGIPFLIFYLLIFSNVVKNVLNFENKIYTKIYISFLISFLVYIMFEKVLLFSTGYAPIMFTIFLVIIPKLMKKKEIRI